MYYTVTLNPAIDMLVSSKDFLEGKLNRTDEAKYVVGGKGINISILLNNIEKETCALGYVAGFTGEFIKNELKRRGVKEDFVETFGTTRINIKLTTTTETEINTASSSVDKKNIAEFLQKLEKLSANDTVFLSGNIISGMTTYDFVKIAEIIYNSSATLVVDSNKDLVLQTLKYKPFIVKPNEFELGEMFGVEIKTLDDILTYANKLKDLGAKNVLVSRGKDGAVLVTENNDVYTVDVAKGKIISTVAAGDSMLAMFVAKYDETNNFEESLRYASAAGGATSFSVGVGEKDLIESLVNEIKVEKIK